MAALKISEKTIENSILSYLRARGIYCWKNQSVGVFDPKKKVFRKSRNKFHINGVADILGILPDGRFLAIEVKSATGRLTDDQHTFLGRIKMDNGLAIMARSVEDVVEALNQ